MTILWRIYFCIFWHRSLFTTVPLKKNIKCIFNRVIHKKKISTALSERSLKKLLLDVCTKTTFSFSKKLYVQIDGVSVGSRLGPFMTNMIMTKLERVVIKDLLNANNFYIGYMDDTLVLKKKSDVAIVLQALDGFHKHLNFSFENKNNFLVFWLTTILQIYFIIPVYQI